MMVTVFKAHLSIPLGSTKKTFDVKRVKVESIDVESIFSLLVNLLEMEDGDRVYLFEQNRLLDNRVEALLYSCNKDYFVGCMYRDKKYESK